MQKKIKLTNSYESKHFSKREKDLFYSLCDKNPNQIKSKDFKNALLKSGLKSNDNRLYDLFQKLDTSGDKIYFRDFIKLLVHQSYSLRKLYVESWLYLTLVIFLKVLMKCMMMSLKISQEN